MLTTLGGSRAEGLLGRLPLVGGIAKLVPMLAELLVLLPRVGRTGPLTLFLAPRLEGTVVEVEYLLLLVVR